MPEEIKSKSKNWLTMTLLLSCALVIIISFYFFYFKKQFDFITEVSCNPDKEECFERDCSNPDDCPPNGFSIFKRYILKASDFKYCVNEDCTSVCESGEIKCTQIKCSEDPEMGESCISSSTEI